MASLKSDCIIERGRRKSQDVRVDALDEKEELTSAASAALRTGKGGYKSGFRLTKLVVTYEVLTGLHVGELLSSNGGEVREGSCSREKSDDEENQRPSLCSTSLDDTHQ